MQCAKMNCDEIERIRQMRRRSAFCSCLANPINNNRIAALRPHILVCHRNFAFISADELWLFVEAHCLTAKTPNWNAYIPDRDYVPTDSRMKEANEKTKIERYWQWHRNDVVKGNKLKLSTPRQFSVCIWFEFLRFLLLVQRWRWRRRRRHYY